MAATGFPLAPTQEPLVSIAEPVVWSCRIPAGTPADAIVQALASVAQVHAIMRTRFVHRDGLQYPLMVVDDAVQISLVEGRGLPAAGEHEAHLHLTVERGEQADVLRCSMHPAAADAYSCVLFAEDVLRALGNQLPEAPPVAYVQYAAWQTQVLKATQPDVQTYWNKRYSVQGYDAAPSAKQHAVATVPSATVHAIASQAGATHADVVALAWTLALMHWRGERSMAIAYMADGRSMDALKRCAGPCAKPMPLQVDELDMPATDMLRLLARERMGDAERMDDAPVRWSAPDVCTYLHTQAGILGVDAHGRGTSCTAIDDGDHIRLSISTCLVRHDAASLAGMMVNIIHGMAADPACSMKNLSLLSEDDAGRILHTVGHGEPSSVHHTVIERIHRRWKEIPDAVVLRQGAALWTAAALCAAVEATAMMLREQGVGAACVVAVACVSVPHQIVAMLGTLLAGACYVVVDADQPENRKTHIVTDSRAVLVLTDADVRMESADTTDATWVATYPALQDNAYICYTSGSTGMPKGVLVRHANMASYVQWAAHTYSGAHDAVSFYLLTSLAYDISVTPVYASLASGGCLTVPVAGTDVQQQLRAAFSPLDPLSAPCAHDAVKLTPTHISILDTMRLGMTHVRCAVTGGEQLSPEHVRTLAGLDTDIVIYNEYGPTEATVGCTAGVVIDPDESYDVGRPVDGARVHILSAGGKVVPVGAIGEICVAGDGVTRGYVGRPEETSRSFVADPLDATRTMYRTGDLGYWTERHTLVCMGRMDNQMKRHGLRMEPGEIEARLVEYAHVTQAAVDVRKRDANEVLVAWITTSAQVDLAALKQWLASQLLPPMVPDVIAHVAHMPLTASGKLNRAALVLPETEVRAVVHHPQNNVERTIATILCDVLGMAEVDTHDSFFALGGHSLNAMAVVARVNAAGLGSAITLADLFAAPTVQGIAHAVAASTMAYENIEPIPSADDYPASDAQRRLWVMDRMGVRQSAYHITGSFAIDGEIDVERLREALRTIVNRHDILRTTLVEKDGMLRQRISAMAEAPLVVRTASGTNEEEHRHFERWCEDHPFSLEHGPLVAFQLSVRSGRSAVLSVALHHIAGDAWSVQVLLRELVHAYGNTSSLPDVHLQYKDVAAWQQRRTASDEGSRALDYWKTQLKDLADPVDLPADRPRPTLASASGAEVRSSLDAGTVRSIQALAAAHKASPFIVFTSALNAFVHRITDRTDVVLGTVRAGRDHADLQNQIGMYLDILPLRTHVEPEATFEHLLHMVRTSSLEAYGASYPFDRLVDELQVPHLSGRASLFDIAVQITDEMDADIQLDKAMLRHVDAPITTSKYDLFVDIMMRADGTASVRFEYATDLFDAERMQRYADAYMTMLAAACAEPSLHVRSLPMISAEQEAELERFERGPVMPVPVTHLDDMLRDTVRRFGSNTAVEDDHVQFTYDEWSARIDAVASTLKHAGCEHGQRVAVLLDRGADLATAPWALWRCNATYVPLDVKLPDARLAMMLNQAGCSYVLTDGDHADRAHRIAGSNGTVIDIGDAVALAGQSTQTSGTGTDGTVDAAIYFTSGTTGVPKGVRVSHAGLLNTAYAQTATFGIEPADRVGQIASCGFDASLSELLMACCAGAALVCVSAPVLADPTRFALWVGSRSVSVATIPPAYLAAMEPGAVRPLRVLISAGEAARPTDLQSYISTTQCFNAYGPTEAAICASMYRIPQDVDTTRTIAIGSPIANMTMSIRSASGERRMIGVPGELWLSGVALTPGYLGEAPMQVYRTGDLAVWDAQGQAHYIGRMDQQVKIRGQRVECGEVEAALRAHPDVDDVAVDVRYVDDEAATLMAWYVPAPKVELFPSVAEFYVYDDVAYGLMARDHERNERYAAAFAGRLQDATVLEIGPGPELVLTRLALEAGAHRVVCVELLERTYRAACATRDRLGLGDRVEIVHADIRSFATDERFDWCISEIVGAIGGSEGAALLVDYARPFLKNPEHMLPQRSTTMMAAVSVPTLADGIGVGPLAASYIQRIFAEQGKAFDLRMCLRNVGERHLASEMAVFEDLDYTHTSIPSERHDVRMRITRSGPVQGLLVWMRLFVDAMQMVDVLHDQHSWVPVFLPFDGDVAMEEGDVLAGSVQRTLCFNQLNPDFVVTLRHHRGDAVIGTYDVASPHRADYLHSNAFYTQLLPDGKPREIPATDVAGSLRAYIRGTLSEAMVPTRFVACERLPLTANGKVDKASLPTPETLVVHHDDTTDWTDAELAMKQVWHAVIGAESLHRESSFFAVGGDSIRAIQVVSRLREAGWTLEVRNLFEQPILWHAAALLQRSAGMDTPVFETSNVALPIHQWMYERLGEDAYARFHQAITVRTEASYDAHVYEQVLRRLAAAHPALQLASTTNEQGTLEFTSGAAPLLRYVHEPADDAARLAIANDMHAQITQRGPCFGMVVFRNHGYDDLLLIAHHQSVDAVSWHVIVADLHGSLALSPLPTNETLPQPAAVNPMAEWSGWLAAQTDATWLAQERPYWADVQRTLESSPLLPAAEGTRTTSELAVGNVHETLVGTCERYTVQTSDILLAALMHALHVNAWKVPAVMMEHHGRIAPVAGAPHIEDTVGWFTTIYPVVVAGPTDSTASAHMMLMVTKESLRTVPHHGMGYGLVRTPGQVEPIVAFNDLSVAMQSARVGSLVLTDGVTGTCADHMHPVLPVECTVTAHGSICTLQVADHKGTVPGGAGKLIADWAAALDDMRKLGEGDTRVFTPSDLTMDGMDIDELDSFLDSITT